MDDKSVRHLDSRLDLFERHAEGGREKAVVVHLSSPERHRAHAGRGDGRKGASGVTCGSVGS